jgi:hypothetical protein
MHSEVLEFVIFNKCFGGLEWKKIDEAYSMHEKREVRPKISREI